MKWDGEKKKKKKFAGEPGWMKWWSSSMSSDDTERDCRALPRRYLTSRVINRYKCRGDHDVLSVTDLPVSFLSSLSVIWYDTKWCSSLSPD